MHKSADEAKLRDPLSTVVEMLGIDNQIVKAGLNGRFNESQPKTMGH
jgi:hypothetical protein